MGVHLYYPGFRANGFQQAFSPASCGRKMIATGAGGAAPINVWVSVPSGRNPTVFSTAMRNVGVAVSGSLPSAFEFLIVVNESP